MFGMKYKDRIQVEKMINDAAEKKNPTKKKSDKETTTKQQLLILHYLGVLDSLKIDENTKKAKLLSVLLNKDSQNIRQVLTYIDARKIEDSEIKTIENLNAILPLFEEIGMDDATKRIKSDLSKLKID